MRPLEFVRERGRTMLVLEDTRSERLDRLLGAPKEVCGFLRLAIRQREFEILLVPFDGVVMSGRPALVLVAAVPASASPPSSMKHKALAPPRGRFGFRLRKQRSSEPHVRGGR